MKSEKEQLHSIVEQLKQEGIPVREEALMREIAQHAAIPEGIGIRILTIVGVFLAVLLFHGFLFTFRLNEFPYIITGIGSASIIGSILFQWRRTDYLADTLTLALFACGYALLLWALNSLDMNLAGICLISMAVAVLAATLARNYLHPFVSAALFSTSLMVWLVSEKQFTGIHFFHLVVLLAVAWFYLEEAQCLVRLKKKGNLYDPLRLGFSLTFLLINYWYSFFRVSFTPLRSLLSEPYWFSVPVALVVLVVVRDMLRKFRFSEKQQAGGLALAVLLLVITLGTPVMGASVLILLLGFRNGDKLVVAIGLLALIGATGRYYYDLRMTLLLKAGCMAATGALLLTGYILLRKKTVSDDKAL